jgi:hypothetical protein
MELTQTHMSLIVFMSGCMHVFICVNACLCACIYVCLSVCLSVCVGVWLCVCVRACVYLLFVSVSSHINMLWCF